MSEKMRECKACKQQIAYSAKVCPNCGAKNKRMSPVLIGIIVFVALIIVIAAASGNDEPVKVGDTPQSGTSMNSPNDKNTFAIGEIAQLRDIQAALISVTESTGSSFNKPSDGNVFVLCEFEITNNSKEEITISSMMSFEAYCDDYTCTYSLSALMEKGNKNQLDGTVAAGKKFNGVIGYEVPVDWKKLELHFTPDFWTDKDIIFIATNN